MELKNNSTTPIGSFGSTEAKLVRLEVMVLFSTLVWILLETLGSFRRRKSNSFFRILVWTLHALSTVLAPYTIGLLQAGPFGDQTFVLWGVILLLMQVNSSAISVYSINDIGQNKSMLVQQISQIFLVLWLILNGRGGNKSYKAAIWIFWSYSIILTVRKYETVRRASKESGLVRYSKVIADYMLVEHNLPQDVDAPTPNPRTIKRYKYIFGGDDEELASLLPTAPEYRVDVKNAKFVTIDTVWGWIDSQGFTSSHTADVYRETTLAHTLFKLLKRRFCGYPLGEAGLQKTLDFVVQGLLPEGGDHVRAFRVIEVELSFLYDFFYTRMETNHEILYWIAPFIAVVIIWNWISGAFSKHYHRSNLEQIVNGTDVIRWVTIVLLASLIFVHVVGLAVTPNRFNIVETVNHNFSEIISGTAGQPGTVNTAKKNEKFVERGTWEKKLGRYSLLLNFDGVKAGKKVDLHDAIIVRVLSRFKENCGKLENGQAALARNGLGSQLSWARTLPTHIHTILVWHIGTTICGNEPEAPTNIDRLLAESLSEYCAYLVASVPDMLPGHGYDTHRILDAVVMEAETHLAGCKTMSDRCGKLKRGLESRYDNTILAMGAKLGRQLIEMVPDEEQRWKVLADFWEEFILFLAPSDNADIHLEKLATGGEFMTHLWTLLTHAGILKRPSSSCEVEPMHPWFELSR